MTKPNLKQLATREFTDFTDWLKRPSTIFENDKVEVWIKNEGGWCTMTAMQKDEKLNGRRYSEILKVGYFDPQEGWKVSEHLDKNYPVWVTTTKRLWGVVR